MKKTSMIMIMMIGLMTIVSAQQTGGVVRGKVTTVDNKPAAMVTVVVKNTKKSALSGDDGTFTLRNMQPGNYELEISLVGYETASQEVSVRF